MNTRTVPLEVADPQSAIRYLGEMQSRAMDPIHEPIQNLLDEGAKQIDVELDRQKHEIRIRGDASPITKQQEARRILRSICASTKIDKLGEKGVGMLSFVNAGSSMTMISQKGGKTVWLRLRKDDLRTGEVGSENRNRLPYAGSEVRIAGVSPRNLKYRFAEDRVIKDVKRRWGSFLKRGVRISVNRKDVASFAPPLQGDPLSPRVSSHLWVSNSEFGRSIEAWDTIAWRLSSDLRCLAHEGSPAPPASPSRHSREALQTRRRASRHR